MSTKLPTAVQRQLEDVERIDGEIAAELAADPAAPAPPAEPETAPPPVADPPPAAPPPEESWHHKYLTLQGMFNTQTATLRGQVETLTAELKALKEAKPATTPDPAAPAPAAPAKLVTDADVAAFGEDLVDLIKRAAQEASGPEQARLLAEIDRLKEQIPTLAKTVERAAENSDAQRRDTYFADLGKMVSDYEAVNIDEAFIGWLTLPDPLSGIVRNNILQDAFAKFDHERTAHLFNAFKKETGRTAPDPTPTPKEPEPTKDGLEAQVSPGSSKTPAVITPDDGQKIWTSAEVQEFYSAVTRGDYRGDPKAVAKIDADIDRALIEGRVRG